MDKINYSIIIPHKNIPQLLKRCIISIPQRSDIQIIIVDDNSDVEKVDVENFPGLNNKNIEVYYTKEGKGAGYARNIGLKYAKGKWLLFADADDFYAENAWDIFDNYVKTDNDIIYFGVDCVDTHTLKPADRKLKNNEVIETYIINKNDTFLRYTCWEPWNKMFSRKFIMDNSIQFEEILRGNDAMFVLTAGKNARKLIAIKNKLYILTYRSDSLSYVPKKEHKLSSFLLKIRINEFYKSLNLKNLQISPLYDIKEVYNLFGYKEALKYIQITINKRINLFYFLFSDWNGIVRLLKRKFFK